MKYNLTSICIIYFFTISCGVNQQTETSNINQEAEIVNDSQDNSSQKENSWQLVGTVDEFGKTTDDSIIGARFTGTMSNSATTGSPLVVQAQIVKGQIYMEFLEYGRQPADMPNSKFIYIRVRRPNGDVETVGQFLFRGYMVDRGYLPGSNTLIGGDGKSKENQLLEILLSETEPITVRVDMKDADEYNSAVYVFDMDNSGLVDLIKNN